MKHAAILIAVLTAAAGAQQAQPHAATYARELLASKLPCLGCHEYQGDGGRLAPSFTDVGKRRSAAYIRAVIEDPQRRAPGVAMPRHQMPTADRERVIALLSSGATGPDAPATVAPPVAAVGLDGAVLYGKWCAGCHGAAGKGDGQNAKYHPVPPARHADAKAMSARSDDALYDVIAVGGAPYGRSPRMPAFGASLSPAEIHALVAQIRKLCVCQGPAWSRSGGEQR